MTAMTRYRDYEVLNDGLDPFDVAVLGLDSSGDDWSDWSEVSPEPTRAEVADGARAIAVQAQASSLTPPPLVIDEIQEVEKYEEPDFFQVEFSEDTGLDEVLGGAYRAVLGEDLPNFSRLREKYRRASPPARKVRVDTAESYDDFRDGLRVPYILELARRLEALERAYAMHVADGHGGGDAHLWRAGDWVAEAIPAARRGGSRIPFLLPAQAQAQKRGAIDCWQDGESILCSARFLGPDGRVRVATTGTPAAHVIDEVVGYADRAGVMPDVAVHAVPALAQIIGGRSCLALLCAASPQLLSVPGVAMGIPAKVRVSPASDADVAAAMSLLQMCAHGDRVACRERDVVRATPGGEELLARAERCTARAYEARQSRALGKVI